MYLIFVSPVCCGPWLLSMSIIICKASNGRATGRFAILIVARRVRNLALQVRDQARGHRLFVDAACDSDKLPWEDLIREQCTFVHCLFHSLYLFLHNLYLFLVNCCASVPPGSGYFLPLPKHPLSARYTFSIHSCLLTCVFTRTADSKSPPLSIIAFIGTSSSRTPPPLLESKG